MKKLVILLVAAAVLRLAFVPVFEGDDHDGTARTLVAANWVEHPYMIEGTTPWPMLNYLTPALAIAASGEKFWSVRILYLLLALTNIVLLFLVVREFLGETAAWPAAALLALNPYHIRCALNGGMSEPPYVSFVLLALFLIGRYRQAPRLGYLLGAGLAINLATMFRFDAVLFGPLAAYVLFVPPGRLLPDLRNGRAWRDVVVLGLVCAIFPAFVAARWQQLHGDPLYFLHTAQANSEQFFVAGRHSRSPGIYQAYTLLFWPASTFLILTPVVAAMCFVGAVRAIIERRQAELAVVFFLICAWFMYSTYRHTILAQFRYTLILQALALSYFGPGFSWTLQRFPALSRRTWSVAGWTLGLGVWLAIVAATFVDAGVITRQMRTVSPVQPGAYASRAALSWIREQVPTGERVLVTPEVGSPYFTLEVGELVREGRIDRLTVYPLHSNLVYTRAGMEDAFRQRVEDARYVLLRSKGGSMGLRDGIFKGVLSPPASSADSFEEFGIRFRPVAVFGPLRIYQVGSTVREDSTRAGSDS